MKLVNKMSKLLIFIYALAIPIQSVFAYYNSSDNVINTLNTIKYKIEINSDGGTFSDILLVRNNKVVLPNAEKENYNFLGYSLNENGTVIYYGNNEINVADINNKKLYAVFEEQVQSVNAIEKILQLAQTDTENIIADDGTTDHNIRYYGSDPNNYVKFSANDTDMWRIIGLFNNIEDINGNKSPHLKLVREMDIGSLAWDSSEPDINDGYGINEWSDADLMKLLNPNYSSNRDSIYDNCTWDFDTFKTTCTKIAEDELVNNSLWWNSARGKCYDSSNNIITFCDFTSDKYRGPSQAAKEMIDTVMWSVGGIVEHYSDNIIGTVANHYKYERGSVAYDCSEPGSTKCPRTTKWLGKVALIYPSDYGYATADSSTMTREYCLNNLSLNHFGTNGNTCGEQNYLNKNKFYLSPQVHEQESVMRHQSVGSVVNWITSFSDPIYPSVYLKTNINIVNGSGTSGDPYILG